MTKRSGRHLSRVARLERAALHQRAHELEEQRAQLVERVAELELLCKEGEQREQECGRAQQRLDASLGYYAELFNFAPVALVTLDPFGLITEANLTASRLLGRDRSSVVGCPLAHCVTIDDRAKWIEHLRRCRAGEPRVVTKLVLQTDRGTLHAELRTEAERPGSASFRAVILDRTDQLAAEREQVRLQGEALALQAQAESRREADAAKDRFIGMLSHELRTPLSPILASVRILQLDRSLPESEVQTYLGIIRRNVEAEARLVDDLLDVTRMLGERLAIERRAVDLHALAQDALQDFAQLARERAIELRCELRATHGVVSGDPQRLKQVLDNLLGNALKFTPAGGRVSISSDNPRLDWVRLEVSDNGAGLTREEMERLFRPFEQAAAGRRAREGLGLGLAISRGIIEAHGGEIRAYSSGAERGARFAIELALSPWPTAARHLRTPELETGSGGVRSVRVLVVEDHPDTGATLCRLLQRYGYRVRLVASVEKAVQEAAEGCDIVISDLGLPDGSGHTLPGRLPRSLPAIAVSGYGADDDVQRSIESGFLDHLMKPVPAEELIQAIERALGESRPKPGRSHH